jgi:predicted dehydrogenase
MMQNKINRRIFLKKTARITTGSIMAPAFIPGSVLGKNGSISPGNRITLGIIGMGNMGINNTNQFFQMDDVRILAVCDLDAVRLQRAKTMVDMAYDNKDCSMYHDFRDLLSRKDIDAVCITTPDHWHGIVAVEAARAGKDIYGEKPLSHNFSEGRIICNAVQRYNRIWQTGSWQRSVANFRFACELVKNGRIGKISHVEVGLPGGYSTKDNPTGTPTKPPPELDYDFWLGPAPTVPYFDGRVHWNWRWQLAFGGGQLLDWVGHHVDIAHWGLGLDLTGPVEIEGIGEYPDTGPWDTAYRYRIETRYRNGLTMTIAGGHPDIRMGTRWIGEHGWIWVTRGDMETSPISLMKEKLGYGDIRLYYSEEHRRNFIDCVKTRKPAITPCEVAHRSATPGHLGQIAMRLGRKIRFDPEFEKILHDDTATRMLSRPMRKPWQIS